MLLLDLEAQFAQAVNKSVFINFFQVPMPVINMDRVGGLADDIAEFIDGLHSMLTQERTPSGQGTKAHSSTEKQTRVLATKEHKEHKEGNRGSLCFFFRVLCVLLWQFLPPLPFSVFPFLRLSFIRICFGFRISDFGFPL